MATTYYGYQVVVGGLGNMDIINLESVSNPYTFVSNIFINDYMPEANGEFVKVYLFLLKLYNESNTGFNIDELADKLLQTRSGIIRALKYWESKKLLSLKKDGDSITNIRIIPIACDSIPIAPDSSDDSDDSLKSEETDTDIKLTAKSKKKVGIFEGAGYSLKGVYRPSYDCRMRTNENPVFCPVCSRALRRIIDFYTSF